MFTTVLVANRGEIAVRVLRTLRRMGVGSVAIFSDADREALHVSMADVAVHVGPADARSSYLSIERVVAAALQAGAQAIHPGYGFLSENADFAGACELAGIAFVGPRSENITAMGDKRAAKDAVAALGVPVVPGFHGGGDSDLDLAAQVESIGFPVIIKPAAGGGGKGMHVVTEPSEVAAALASARREALSAFGDDSLLLERFVASARHVEVQVIGDGEGRVVHLGDRDCSLQRRHQKVIEEAPAPFLSDAVRDRMRSDAVAIAESVAYRGVGTVEFIVDADDPSSYFFLEMNTRLQVEHPVTEAVTGLDLVELQLRVAAGEGLPITQHDVQIEGNAVEARVYAEDGHRGFLPASGTVLAYDVPPGVRVDSGITRGSVVGTWYDPLLAKVIATGSDRAAAFDALDAALADIVVLGVAHNVGVLRQLVSDPRVREGSMTTRLIADLKLGEAAPELDSHALAAAVLGWQLHAGASVTPSVWDERGAWRVGGVSPVSTRVVDEGGLAYDVAVVGPPHECHVVVGEGPSLVATVVPVTSRDGDVVVTVDGVARRYSLAFDASGVQETIWIGRGGDSWPLRRPRRSDIARRSADGANTGGELRSPMPGAVVVLPVSLGDSVREGAVIAVIEAMKMEYPLTAPFDGVMEALVVVLGTQVVRDQLVAVVTPEESS